MSAEVRSLWRCVRRCAEILAQSSWQGAFWRRLSQMERPQQAVDCGYYPQGTFCDPLAAGAAGESEVQSPD